MSLAPTYLAAHPAAINALITGHWQWLLIVVAVAASSLVEALCSA